MDKPASPIFSSDPSSNPNWMLDHHIMLMVSAEANNEYHKQWVYYKFVMRRLLPYMDTDTQKALETDWAGLVSMEYEIEKGGNDEASKSAMIALHKNFIKTHDSYNHLAMIRAGQMELQKNAEVDFSKNDSTLVKRIVRLSNGGFASSILESAEREAEKDEKP